MLGDRDLVSAVHIHITKPIATTAARTEPSSANTGALASEGHEVKSACDGSEALDMVLTPHAKQAGLATLAVPMRVRGTLADPSVYPDPMAALAWPGGL